MKRNFTTVKTQIITRMILLILLISIIVLAFSYFLIYRFHNQSTEQSAAFNLQLVTNLIEEDLSELITLTKWSGNNSHTSEYFTNPSQDSRLAIHAYDRIMEEVNNNRARKYVHRLIVTDQEQQRILQFGSFTTHSRTLNPYTLRALALEENLEKYQWNAVMRDPLSLAYQQVIPYASIAYDQLYNRPSGMAYLFVSPTIITDKLVRYHQEDGSYLVLSINETHYLLENNTLEPLNDSFELLSSQTDKNTGCTLSTVRRQNGSRQKAISATIEDGLSITQVLSPGMTQPIEGLWIGLIVAILLLITLLAAIFTFYLDKKISQPVTQLTNHMREISKGNFSRNQAIESEDEIGQIGQGINQLAADMQQLITTRVEDERKKKDLEYQMLQNQINPHFLYNTLNSMKWMATIQGAHGIAEMITSLSRMLEEITKDTRKIVPLSEELSTVEDYFLIQNYRYFGNIAFEKEIADPTLLDTPVPRFIIQPIIENAIFHGIEPKGKGTVRLIISEQEDTIRIAIRDDGVGMSEEKINSLLIIDPEEARLDKVGIHNVNQRLLHTYGEAYRLTIKSVPDQHTEVTIEIPTTIPQKQGEDNV